MQQHESNGKFANFWKTKGYYALLGLCAVAVAVSGYVFVRDAAAEQEAVQQSLSTPVTLPETSVSDNLEELPVQQDQTEETLEPVQDILPETVMPVSGTVIRDYAMDHLTYNATTQDWRVHNGVDLAAPLGQAVGAARAGTVTAVYDDDYYGVTVVVQHEDGYTTHYAGLAEGPAVSAGDTVAAGQTIGIVGATALIESAQEPHLHFEVCRNGEPMDPAGFLY